MTRNTLTSLLAAATLFAGSIAPTTTAYAGRNVEDITRGAAESGQEGDVPVIPPTPEIRGDPAVILPPWASDAPEGCVEHVTDNPGQYRELICEPVIETPSGARKERVCGEDSMKDIVSGFVGTDNPLANPENYSCGAVNLEFFGGLAIRGLCPGQPEDIVCVYNGELDLGTALADQNQAPIFGDVIYLTEGQETTFTLDKLIAQGFISDAEGDDLEVTVAPLNIEWANYDSEARTFTFNPTFGEADVPASSQSTTNYLRFGVDDGTNQVEGNLRLVVVNADDPNAQPETITVVEHVEVPGPTEYVDREVIVEVPAPVEPKISHPWGVRAGALYLTGPEGSLTGGIVSLEIPIHGFGPEGNPFRLVPGVAMGSYERTGLPEDSTTPVNVPSATGTNYVTDTDQGTMYNQWTRSTTSDDVTVWTDIPEDVTAVEGRLGLESPRLQDSKRIVSFWTGLGGYVGGSQADSSTGTTTNYTTHTTDGSLVLDTDGDGMPDTEHSRLDTVSISEETPVGLDQYSTGGIYAGGLATACFGVNPITSDKGDLGFYICAEVGAGTDGDRVGGQFGIAGRFGGKK